MYNCPVKLIIFGKYEKTQFLVDSFWRGSPWKISEFVRRAFGEFSRNSPDFCGERRVERLSKNFRRVKMSAERSPKDLFAHENHTVTAKTINKKKINNLGSEHVST